MRILAIAACFLLAGCITTGDVKTESETTADEQVEEVELEKLRADLDQVRAENRALKEELKILNGARKIDAQTYARRLAAVEAARDEAIKEVVRARARIQGMASPAEAAAMFAEARVIIDRMSEEAYNDQAVDFMKLGKRYLENGREEMEQQNPGGAAYLFNLISSLYESFQATDPRAMTVNTKKASLRASATASSKRLGLLSYGEKVEGLARQGKWIRVDTPSNLKGWVHSDLLR
ncbi:SH3 domain-containing protein [bacterium]|nr:MAG: SH3 domain-containing protein [bacterium]